MKKLTTITMAFALALLTLNSASAQEGGSSSGGGGGFKDRFFISLGHTIFLDFFGMPNYSNIDTADLYYGGYSENKVYRQTGYSIYTFGAKFRVNLVDLNDNTSIDVHAWPALGISLMNEGDGPHNYFGSLSFPIMAGINFGNISTYKTSQNKGFGFGIGYEYFNGGLFGSTESGNNYVTDNVIKKTGMPVIELDYRYWSKSNKAREFSVLIGFGGSGSSKIEPGVPPGVAPPDESPKGSYHYRLMWSHYINY
jgi:hypothetical protein